MKFPSVKTVRLLAVLSVAGAQGATSVNAGLLASDSFEDYTVSSNIHGQGGGNGWSGEWAVLNIAGAEPGAAMVSSTEITYDHGGTVLGGGQSLQLSTASNGTRRNVFGFSNSGGGDYYVSFICRFDGTVFTGWQALDDNPDIAKDCIGLINTNGAVGARVDGATDSTAEGLVSAGATFLMVVQYTGWTGMNYSTVNVWINPAPGGRSGGVPTATSTDDTPGDGGGSEGFLGVYVRTLMDSGESCLIDDLRVGTDWESVTQPAGGLHAAD